MQFAIFPDFRTSYRKHNSVIASELKQTLTLFLHSYISAFRFHQIFNAVYGTKHSPCAFEEVLSKAGERHVYV